MGFTIAFNNVLISLLYMLPGYIACKMGKIGSKHLSGLSGLLVYGCSPMLLVSTFVNMDFSLSDLISMGEFMLVTFITQALFMSILYIVLHKKYSDARYRILTIASVMGNVGFFGLPIIRALLPNNPEAACYSAVFIISMNLFVFTMGIFCLTGDKKYIAIKQAVINPSTIPFFFAIILYCFRANTWLPSAILKSASMLGNMCTPMCMLILGIRLANVELKKLFMRPFVYVVCIMKQLVFPLFSYALVYFLPFPEAFKISILILSGTPCAAIVLSMAEMYDAEQELSANCVLVTTLTCILTIPLLTLII